MLETDKEKNARAVLARIGKIVEFELRSLAPYSKGGFEANGVLSATGETWAEVTHGVIAIAQSLAFGWRLGGLIDDEIELLAEERFRVPGILFVSMTCTKPADR